MSVTLVQEHVEPTRLNERYGGWRVQQPDFNDYIYTPTAEEQQAVASVINAKTVIDFRESGLLPPVKNQLQLGSCTANSNNSNLAYNLALGGVEAPPYPSRLFTYYNERAMQGTISQDSGATIRESIKATVKYGAPPETEWPYDTTKFKDKPPVETFTDALVDVDLTYQSVPQTITAMVATLLDKRAIQMGFTVYQQFEDVGSNGIVTMPGSRSGKPLGGHANLVVGLTWIKGEPYWIVLNSWDTTWGDEGFYYMPANYLLTPSLSSDFWRVDTVGKAA